ncbi:hypothetical protein [Lentilactobacillus kisonensis]|nr:hypothetical protein [Lentilactobacillus kisonensis]KRL23556.1 hypothetical protein FC98_GL000284 [Lentilactobacillus kisonensis DSM 19906 = JCM 15041]
MIFISILAIVIDAVMFGAYIFQYQFGNQVSYTLGMLAQVIATLALVAMRVSYSKGKRWTNWRPYGYREPTFGYGIVVVSMIINLIVLFLYGLNIFG